MRTHGDADRCAHVDDSANADGNGDERSYVDVNEDEHVVAHAHRQDRDADEDGDVHGYANRDAHGDGDAQSDARAVVSGDLRDGRSVRGQA